MVMSRILILILVSLPLFINGQENLAGGLLPALNINKKLPKDWSLNFKTESRQALYDDNEFGYRYLLTDFSLASAKKVGINTTLAMGYLLRITEESNASRAIQQLSTIRRYTTFKMAHRIMTDQTFRKSGTTYRFRYRASGEVPLNGSAVDPGELFIKLNHEYLNALEGEAYELEIRAAAFVGYFIAPGSKLELGMDYRLASFLNERSNHRTWMAINYYRTF